jgi:acyl dehydratase
MTLRYLEDLVLGARFPCGGFSFTREDIIDFATKFDPQPFHLDEEAAQRTYFKGLSASGIHTQAAALGCVVRTLTDIAVVAGGSLDQAKFHVPVRPDKRYEVVAWWHEARPSARNPERGVAAIRGVACDEGGTVVMEFGVTYVMARRPLQEGAT